MTRYVHLIIYSAYRRFLRCFRCMATALLTLAKQFPELCHGTLQQVCRHVSVYPCLCCAANGTVGVIVVEIAQRTAGTAEAGGVSRAREHCLILFILASTLLLSVSDGLTLQPTTALLTIGNLTSSTSFPVAQALTSSVQRATPLHLSPPPRPHAVGLGTGIFVKRSEHAGPLSRNTSDKSSVRWKSRSNRRRLDALSTRWILMGSGGG
jgi:hypothetical protein